MEPHRTARPVIALLLIPTAAQAEERMQFQQTAKAGQGISPGFVRAAELPSRSLAAQRVCRALLRLPSQPFFCFILRCEQPRKHHLRDKFTQAGSNLVDRRRLQQPLRRAHPERGWWWLSHWRFRLDKVTVAPKFAPSTTNCTVPVGVPAAEETVAIKVTEPPNVDGLFEDTTTTDGVTAVIKIAVLALPLE